MNISMLDRVQTQADSMSVDVNVMPPWKRELLERKRRQEEEDRKRREEELERLSHMPPWKRELMLKKKKTSTIYMSRSASTNDVDKRLSDGSISGGGESGKTEFGTMNGSVGTVENCVTITVGSETSSGRQRAADPSCPPPPAEWDSSLVSSASDDQQPDGDDSQEEHLLPIDSNPWLKLDPNNRRRGRNACRRPRDGGMANDDGVQSDYSSRGSSTSPGQLSETGVDRDASSDRNDDSDSVFDDEEVTYGRGFVHKLLRRFKHMSAKEETSAILSRKSSPKRTQSSENILEERSSWKASGRKGYMSGDSISGYSSLSRQKAHSVDCLVSKTKPYDSSEVMNSSHCISEESKDVDSSSHGTGLVKSSSEGEFLCRGNSEENMVCDLPRVSIVSAARSVFESISANQNQSSVKKHQSAECISGRSTSASSSTSSSYSIASPQMTHSLSSTSSCGDQLVPDTDSNISPRTSSIQKVPSSGMFFPAKKPPTSSGAGSQITKPSDKTAGQTDNDAATKPAPIQVSKATKEARSTYSNSSTSSVSVASVHGTVTEDHCSAQGVHKAQESHDQATRDQTTHVSDKTSSISTSSKCPEAPTVSEEITVVLNQSAKDDTGIMQSADAENNVTDESLLNTPSLHRTSTPKDTAASTENRSSGANRHNLNLNLNELNRKKITQNDEMDINRNSKLGSATNTTDLVSDSTDGSFPVSLLRKKKSKRPAPSGPGSLLIRPASNLVAAGVKTEFLCLNKYRDIKDGEFAPAKKRPSHYYEGSDDDIPITDIDDYLPISNIDDVSPIGTPREGDPTQQKQQTHKYEFDGAGVILDRSLLSKTKHKKMKLSFNDAATSTFEYPSEQSLLDIMPPEPGDFDFHDPDNPGQAVVNGSASDDEPPEFIEVSGLRPTPGVGSGGALGSYQSKCQVDYFFGMEQPKEMKSTKKREEPETTSTRLQPTVDEDFTWSDAASSDMLF